jgi:hypothetical protein
MSATRSCQDFPLDVDTTLCVLQLMNIYGEKAEEAVDPLLPWQRVLASFASLCSRSECSRPIWPLGAITQAD